MIPLLDVQNLHVSFGRGTERVPAVRGVSFVIRRGEMVGLVGESGCGKSVTALSLLRLVPTPGAIEGGRILLEGKDLLGLAEPELRRIRGGRISLIFQDPFSSLNPTMTVGAQLVEAIRQHARCTPGEAKRRALDLLAAVRIPAPEQAMRRFPHEISGGQRQRVMIAIAFAAGPDLVVADEPTTALDVTVQSQVLSLMDALRRQTGAAILLITHDLGIVAQTCDRVLVMYAGEIVEEAPSQVLFTHPRHPYTEALLHSLPSLEGPRQRRLPTIPGQPPAMDRLPAGCPFADRCAKAMAICTTQPPPATHLDADTLVRCWLHSETGGEPSVAPPPV